MRTGLVVRWRDRGVGTETSRRSSEVWVGNEKVENAREERENLDGYYWVGQKVHLGFLITFYRNTQTNFFWPIQYIQQLPSDFWDLPQTPSLREWHNPFGCSGQVQEAVWTLFHHLIHPQVK